MALNLNFPLNVLSYGVCGFNILRELYELAPDISLFPIGRLEVPPDHSNLVGKCLQNAQKFDFNAPTIRLFHQFSLAESVGRGERIGFPIFELDKFNEIEEHHLKSCDRIFVPSKWAQGVIWNANLGVPCEVVPLGVDTSIFWPSQYNNQNREKYVFLNCAKIEYRKGHDILPELFSAAFSPSDPVELWMMPHNFFVNAQEKKEWYDMFKNCTFGPNIRILDWVDSQSQVVDLMHTADCGIFPSRAEGFCLPALEMLACNKPIIITNYSGPTEYCNESNAKLINVQSREPAIDGKWFFGQGEWAAVQENFDEWVDTIRNFAYNKVRGNPSGVQTAHQFSWANTAKRIIELTK